MRRSTIAVTVHIIFAVLVAVAASRVAVAELNCNAGIEFYPGGGIKSCNLNGNHQLYTARGQRLVCANGYTLVQYPDGELKSCTISVALTVGATAQCDRLSHVELAADGAVVGCE